MDKNPGVLIVGDSNTRHLSQEIYADRKLANLPIYLNAISGRRAMDLDHRDLENCLRFRYVVLMLGNNDLGQFRDRPAIDPELVAFKLIAFAELLLEEGTRVRVIKLLPRTDVRKELIDICNAVLKRHLGRNLFSQMTIYRQKFNTRGGYHPNQTGRLDLLRGLYKACKTFGFC